VRAALWLVLGLAACSRDRETTPSPAPTPTSTSTSTPTPTPTPTRTATPTTRVVAGVYHLVVPRPDPALDSTATLLSAALDAFVPARFGRLPSAPITVFVFPTTTEYDAFCASHYSHASPDASTPSETDTCLDSLGIYFHPRRELVVDLARGRTTLLHELAHTLFEDFAEAPLWLEEGISSQYEWPDFPLDQPGEVHGKSNFRHQRLLDALRSTTERGSVHLDALFGMTDAAFRGKPATGEARKQALSLHYALAREACRYLDARGLLWPFYAAWRDRVGVDPTGEAAFARVVGETPKQANAEWMAWVTDKRNDDRTAGRVP